MQLVNLNNIIFRAIFKEIQQYELLHGDACSSKSKAGLESFFKICSVGPLETILFSLILPSNGKSQHYINIYVNMALVKL